MSETHNMHYVPQTYLRRFSTLKGSSHFIYALPKGSFNPDQIKHLNVKNICVKKNIYLLPGLTVEERQFIEKMYDDLYEKDYNYIYEIITDSTRERVTDIQRHLIIGFVVSMYLRNISWHNFFGRITDNVIERGYEMTKANGKESFFVDEREIIIMGKSLEQVQKEEKEKDRSMISTIQAKKIFELIRIREANDIVSVIKLENKYEFVTSDNPVVCHPDKDTWLPPMHPDNTLSIAIDSKHMVQLRPWAHHLNNDLTMLGRISMKDMIAQAFTLAYNDKQFNQTETFVLGTKHGLKYHIDERKRPGS